MFLVLGENTLNTILCIIIYARSMCKNKSIYFSSLEEYYQSLYLALKNDIRTALKY